ncbi:MAG TPA: putative glycolipid-binding domain-containing protein [Thermomicrobiales bacterium]|nr:putative glycolipid-binding domain-containing protein [Thermomicrobiales bacterium]
MTAINALWRSLAWPGKEHLYLVQRPGGWLADGLVMASIDSEPFRFHYRVELDAGWNFRHLWTHQPFLDIAEERLPDCELSRDADGAWHSDGFENLPDLAGCVDIDITITPFTNTLPIRRLGLEPGQSAEIDVAYLSVPELTLSRVRQRYTRLESSGDFDYYRFESLDGSEFSAEIGVDRDGLVVDYPDLFTRL